MQQTAPAKSSAAVDDPLARSLVEDLRELREYYRAQPRPSEVPGAAELAFLVGLARHRFSPDTETILAGRGQIMVFGGAGAGKSTTVNILAGGEVAEVNTQAGFTRHPTAVFLPRAGVEPEGWPDAIGDLKRSDRDEEGSLDADCYSTRTPIRSSSNVEFLEKFVLWDCPDLTTRDATYYADRVVEIAALADLCVYVASDERYNDELPTQFFHWVLEAGKPTIVVMTKMSPLDVDEFIHLFRQQVVGKTSHPQYVVEVYAVPTPVGAKVADLWTGAFSHGERMRELAASALADVEEVRRRGRIAALDMLAARRDALLTPVEDDVQQWRMWFDLVRRAANTAVARYEKEYLDRSVGADSWESLQTLLAAFALPGRGAYLWRALEYLRAPYRIVKAIARKYIDRGNTGEVDEEQVLESVRTQLVDSLIVAVATRRQTHPFWEELHQSLLDQDRLPCQSLFREIHARQAREIRLKNREASDQLEERFSRSSAMVWGMRSARLAIDVGAMAGGLSLGYRLLGGWSLWSLGFVLGALGVADDVVRIVCHELVRRHREDIVRRRKDNIREVIQTSYTDVFTSLPKGVSERLGRMSQLCVRLPKTIKALLSRLRVEGRP